MHHGESQGQAVMVTCDLASIHDELRDAVRGRLESDCGELSSDAIFIGATHAHSAPDARLVPYGMEPCSSEYRRASSTIRWQMWLIPAILIGIYGVSIAEESTMDKTSKDNLATWQEKAVDYARIMSRVKWTPVAEGMPLRSGGHFEKGTEYTGVPYSSVKSVGRYIGFDIFLKTFLAAVDNPLSVLYTENLSGKVSNAAAYYGKVCSSYTSYALQCGIWYVSRHYGPTYREGIQLVDPQSAQAAEVGDVIFTPPASKGGGSHIEIVTGITRNDDGTVTHVRVEESYPPTIRNTDRDAPKFDAHISAANRELYRITDLDAWRGANRAESFLFPNYEEDSTTPVINRVLLLDLGDWVPYRKDQVVRINVMDRDDLGVNTLVIKRGNTVVENIEVRGPGVVERSFSTCGDYTAHCVMTDGSLSQACEFSVCDIDFKTSVETVTLGEPWKIAFTSDNMDVVIVYLYSEANEYNHRTVFVTDQDRRNGKVVIPADLMENAGKWQIWLIGENRYGRLNKQRPITVVAQEG